MSIKSTHIGERDKPLWFVTFTCCQWLQLFAYANCYDLVYKWFNYLRESDTGEIVGYVIMPNHVHVIVLLNESKGLNKVMANSKRFLAYEIVKRLNELSKTELLEKLSYAVSDYDKRKGQKHKVFETSFDAKEIMTEKFFFQKLDYIHNNPLSKKWALADSITAYEHSSAAFYELGTFKHFRPLHYREI